MSHSSFAKSDMVYSPHPHNTAQNSTPYTSAVVKVHNIFIYLYFLYCCVLLKNGSSKVAHRLVHFPVIPRSLIAKPDSTGSRALSTNVTHDMCNMPERQEVVAETGWNKILGDDHGSV